jgi:hypothetical protein
MGELRIDLRPHEAEVQGVQDLYESEIDEVRQLEFGCDNV